MNAKKMTILNLMTSLLVINSNLQADRNVLGDGDVGSNNGTLTNGALNTITAPVIGVGALELDGVDDYVEVTDYKGVTGMQSRTCSDWI